MAQLMLGPLPDPLSSFHHGEVNLACFVPVVTLMRMTHQDLPLLKVGSYSDHGARWPLM